MDNYWPLRGGRIRDVTTGQIIGLEIFTPEQLGGLFWYVFSLHQEFAGDPEQIDAAQAMLRIVEVNPAAPKLVVGSDPGVTMDQALEAARETIRLHDAQLADDAMSYWKGGSS